MQRAFRYSFLGLLVFVSTALAVEVPRELKPTVLSAAGIVERLGAKIDLPSFSFKDESGTLVPLATYFGSKPVILNFVYFECPNLCSAMLNGFMNSLKRFDWTPGDQFEIVTVSIDPREGPALAAAKKAKYLANYARPGAEKGWHFLTGTESELRRLASTVGFGYQWDEKEKQYMHSAGLFVMTPDGTLSRLLYGIDFNAKQLKLSLLEASRGKIGTVVEKLLLYCYRYDPNSRTYSFYISKIMQAGGALTVLILAVWLGLYWRRQLVPTAYSKGETT